MKKTFQITSEGKKELEVELEELKGQRGRIADKIAEARDYGDLSENAEYDSAREEQGLVETRIAEIEDILTNAELIRARSSSSVSLGSHITLSSGKKTFHYTVVGPVEADPLEGKISNVSPLGEALIGKKVGEQATISTPKGSTTFTIESLT